MIGTMVNAIGVKARPMGLKTSTKVDKPTTRQARAFPGLARRNTMAPIGVSPSPMGETAHQCPGCHRASLRCIGERLTGGYHDTRFIRPACCGRWAVVRDCSSARNQRI